MRGVFREIVPAVRIVATEVFDDPFDAGLVTLPAEREMTVSNTGASPSRGRPLRSTLAILMGFVAVVALSLCTDQVLHVLHVFPPWNQPMRDPGLNLLALSYRCVYAVLGSYLAARFAPHSPMRHAMILGVIGLVISGLGAVAALTMVDLGPKWYPIALVVTTLPCAWLGGVLHRQLHAQR